MEEIVTAGRVLRRASELSHGWGWRGGVPAGRASASPLAISTMSMCAKKKSGSSALSKTTTATVSLDSMRENRASSSLIITLSIRFRGGLLKVTRHSEADDSVRVNRVGVVMT
jgi:hypothetical protein